MGRCRKLVIEHHEMRSLCPLSLLILFIYFICRTQSLRFSSEGKPVEQEVRGDEEDGHADHEARVLRGSLFISLAGRVDAQGSRGPGARYARC